MVFSLLVTCAVGLLGPGLGMHPRPVSRAKLNLQPASSCRGTATSNTNPKGWAFESLLRQAPLLRPAATPSRASPIFGGVPYESLTIGVIKETKFLEKRVAQSPDSVALLIKSGFKVVVEEGAGAAALLSDSLYVEAGAHIVPRAEAWGADIVVKINPPTAGEA